MTAPTALVMHPDCALHDTGWGHPEHQGRLPAVVKALYRDTPALLERVLQREAVPAGIEDLRRVHTAGHIERVRRAVEEAAARGEQVFLDADTPVSAASWDAALAAAGCAVTGTALVLDGAAATAFAAARPPGHHATAEEPMGFCLFNNVAVAARWAQAERGIERVLIVDWDVHHGNGTQDIFYEDPSVYYLSLHLAPHYPGTGSAAERGAGPGEGTTRNVPLPAGTTGAAYRRAFDAALDATLDEFAPELVLVSAGFDCLAGDPLGGLALEPATLHGLTLELLDRTRATAEGRLVAVLEGGYVPQRLGDGVLDVVRALAGLPSED
ncbi:MAG TPA: histone deacetylase [Longimicrobiales bacterium]